MSKPSVVIYYDRETKAITNVGFYNNKEQYPLEKLQEMAADWNKDDRQKTYVQIVTDPIVEAAFNWVKPQSTPFRNIEELADEIDSVRKSLLDSMCDLEKITDRLAETPEQTN